MFENDNQQNDQHILETFGEFKVPEIEATLKERGERYGNFAEHARITQNIKRAMQDSKNWDELSDDKKEALEMIAHKVGRILKGDPEYHDSWHDIIGYSKLVEETLKPEMIAEIPDDIESFADALEVKLKNSGLHE